MPLKIKYGFSILFRKKLTRTKELSQRKVGVNVKKKELSLEKNTFVVLFLKFTAMRRADMTNLPV